MLPKKSRSGKPSVVREVERCLLEEWGALTVRDFSSDDVCRVQQEAVDLAIIEVGITVG